MVALRLRGVGGRVADDPRHIRYVERLLAYGRLLLSVASLSAVYIEPTEPSRFAPVAYVLLSGYVAYSGVILLVLQRPLAQPHRMAPWLHLLDVTWATGLTVFTTGPYSPFFLFFAFTVLGAALRWGLFLTLVTALGVILVLVLEAFVVAGAVETSLTVSRVIIRTSYVLVLAIVAGMLGEAERALRLESQTIARTLAALRDERRLGAAIGSAFRVILESLGMAAGYLLIREADTGRVFFWTAQPAPGGDVRATVTELGPVERSAHEFDPGPAHAWMAVRRDPANPPGAASWQALNDSGDAIPGYAADLPPGLASIRPWRSLFGTTMTLADRWTGLLIVADDRPRRPDERALAFLQALGRSLSPALQSVSLLRRLRTRIGALERGRIARELHDGAIQSLMALQLQLEVFSREVGGTAEWVPARLDGLQRQLHEGVLSLRDLMQELQLPESASGHLVNLLAERIERFGRSTGINARFITELSKIEVSPRVSQELLRIVQEALVNVRKHSGANNVVVWLKSTGGFWQLVVDDDGRGFDFEGRWSHEELEQRRRGPLVIRDRVRGLGGTLTIESNRGRGARLEIAVPHRMS